MSHSADSKASEEKLNHRSLGAIFLTVFLDLVGFSIIFPLFPAMLEWYLPREGTESTLGALIHWIQTNTPAANNEFLTAVLFGGILGSLYSLLQFVFSPFWGRLSDQRGRRSILLITITGTFLSYLIWIFSGPFILLLVARVVGGIMAGNISVATAAVADVTSRANRSKGMGMIGMAFGLGFIIGPAIGGLVAYWNPLEQFPELAAYGINPFSGPAAAAALLALINLVWVYKAFPETNTQQTKESSRRGWFGFIGQKNPAIRQTIRVYLVFITAFSAMEFTLTFLATERLGYSPHKLTLIFLFIGFILAFTQGYIVRKYARKIGETNMILAGCLSGSLGLFILASAQNNLLFYPGLAALGIGIGLASPSLSALISLYAKEDEQGAQLGAFRSAGSFGRAIGPIIGALIFWALGSAVAYICGGALLIVALFLGFLLPQPRIEEHEAKPS